MRSLKRTAGGALLLTLLLAPRPGLAAVTGAIEGTVVDQQTGKKLGGVTVSVSSPALQGEQTEFTGADGHYIITELPPGEYLVRFYFSDIKVERPGVVLQADKTLSVSISFPTQKAEVKTYRITEKTPTVDVGNTQVQTQVTAELVRNTPIRGRTYDSVLALAPGAATDAVGISFSGATGPENNFLVDGINTTQPSHGLLGTQLTLEFVGETEIITGGYNAEYGRATGGVVNVITKSGSNEFHGDVWLYYSPQTMTLAYPNIGRAGEALARRTQQNWALDFGFDIGGPIVKDKIWFYAGFAPTLSSTSNQRLLRTRQAKLMNGPSGAMYDEFGNKQTGYLGDIDTSPGSCPSWLDPRFCSPSYITNVIGGTTYTNTSYLLNWIAKLNFQFNPNNSLSVQYVGSPHSEDGALGGRPFDAPLFSQGPGTFLATRTNDTHDALLHFVSKLFDRKLQVDAVLGYHYEQARVAPNDSVAGNDPSILYLQPLPLSGFENRQPCFTHKLADGKTPFSPCPVQNYIDGGWGLMNQSVEQRVQAQLAATYFARFYGTHALKLGADFELNQDQNLHAYSGAGAPGGGAIYQVDANGNLTVYRQFANKGPGPKDGDPAVVLPQGFTPTTKTTNIAMYLRDSYNVGFIQGLTINAGVRWEGQALLASDDSVQIGIWDNWAPRLGAIYDFTRQGRGKVYASYGWFYESIPLDINDRQLSKEGLVVGTGASCPGSPYLAGGFRLDQHNCMSDKPTNGDVSGGTFSPIAPGLKGQYSEEVTAGIQYDIGYDLVLGAAYVHRDLPRIIEDMSVDGGNTFIIANPGETPDPSRIADLQKQINATTDPTQKAALQSQLGMYKNVAVGFPKPKRNYDALTITATKRLSHNFQVLASYTYSRTLGNYPGLFQASNGQLDPNISSQYDLREFLFNRDGPLPEDRPHNLKLLGSYLLAVRDGTIIFGAQFNAQSGTPIDVLGYSPVYGRREAYILPRGAGGRTPMVSSFDLHVSYRRKLTKMFTMEAYADVFNLFNQQAPLAVDMEWTTSRVSSIVNGTVADLAALKTNNGAAPLLNPNFGHATAYQAPLSTRLGVRLSF
jgi:hypothetical protein